MDGTPPPPHKEIEIKLELAPASLRDFKKIPLLRKAKPSGKDENQVSVYFDTGKRKLRKKGLMLRVRREGRHYTQTIKCAANGGTFERDEWEAEIAGSDPDFDEANGTALEPVLTKKLRRGLKPVFETRVRRTVYPLVNNGHAIALTVDRGTIETGKRSSPLCEIELELKRGDAADLFDVAHELIRALPARLAVKSKSERGYELIAGEEEIAVKADAVALAEGTSTRDAFRIVGRACLKQIVNNHGALTKGDPEGVHQMRVGLRRLRAAASLFAALLRDPQTAAIKNELKWLAGELGPARELDVLVSRVVTPVKRQGRRWRGMPSLSHEIAERRDAALSGAQAAVQSARFRALTLDIAGWLEAGAWTKPADDLIRDRGDQPIEVFAFEQLTRRWRKVRKKGKVLHKLDARSRHKLRIQTKKLRYAAEFFTALFTTKRALKRRKRFLAALERLQDGLGDLNDIAVHEKRITAAIGVRRRQPNPSRVFAAGLLTGREDARKEATMKAATEAYSDLAKVKPFWR
jgi:inorganic triphosphatase YgiF